MVRGEMAPLTAVYHKPGRAAWTLVVCAKRKRASVPIVRPSSVSCHRGEAGSC